MLPWRLFLLSSERTFDCLDGSSSLLLAGVCRRVGPYAGTTGRPSYFDGVEEAPSPVFCLVRQRKTRDRESRVPTGNRRLDGRLLILLFASKKLVIVGTLAIKRASTLT
jgi:hypothetical protein